MTVTLSEMGDYLVQHAQNGTIVCYSEIDEHFRIPKTYKWKEHPLFLIYGNIDQEDINAHRPLRTSVIVHKAGEKKTVPSEGYFKKLSYYRNIPIAKTAADKRRVHAAELEALRNFYGFQSKA